MKNQSLQSRDNQPSKRLVPHFEEELCELTKQCPWLQRDSGCVDVLYELAEHIWLELLDHKGAVFTPL